MNSKKSALRRLMLLYRAVCKDVQKNTTAKHGVVSDHRARKCLIYMSQRSVFEISNRSKHLTGALISVQTFGNLVRVERAALATLGMSFAVAFGVGFSINAAAAIAITSILLLCVSIIWLHVRAEFKKMFNVEHLETFMHDVDQAATLLGRTESGCLQWLRTPINALCEKATTVVRNAAGEGQTIQAKQYLELFTRLGLVTGKTRKRIKALLEGATGDAVQV